MATSTHQQLGFTGPWFCMKTQTHQDKAAVPGEVLIGSLEQYCVVLVVLIQAQIASSFMLNRVLIRMINYAILHVKCLEYQETLEYQENNFCNRNKDKSHLYKLG